MSDPTPGSDARDMSAEEYRRAKQQIIAASFQAQFERRDAYDAACAATKFKKKDA